MRLKPLNTALAVIFGAGSLCCGSSAVADGLAAADSTLTGSTTVGSTTQSSAGPDFDLTNVQTFKICLCDPYSTYADGSLSQGIIGVQGAMDQTSAGSASETYTTTIVNQGSSAESGSFSFYIGSATLIASPNQNFQAGAGTVSSTIGAAIDVNGATAWSYSATLTGSSASSLVLPSFSMMSSGTGTGPTYSSTLFQDNTVQIVTYQPYMGTVALGTLDPGQSETLTYTLTGDTSTTFAAGELAYYGGSLAQIGDPFSVQGQGLTTFGITPPSMVAAVPEPGTNVMLAGGLALLGALALRRQRKRMRNGAAALA